MLQQTKRKLSRIRDGTFEATRDAAEMVEALEDDEATAVNREYLRRILGA